MIKLITSLTLLLLIGGCTKEWVIPQKTQKSTVNLPTKLPVPISNNAVAYVNVNGDNQFYSFNGLTAGKTFQDITNKAFVWRLGQWHELSVPAAQLPVLASTAVTVNQQIYLYGGYTVAADHTEKSIPNGWQIDAKTDEWKALPAMPTPVDDAVALVYKERYIYLISGWHDVDNVDLVQVFDTQSKTWFQATPFPLPPVFGHAGGIINNQMLVCDGVKVVKIEDKKQFLSSPVCAMGQINTEDFTQIEWQEVTHHSGTAYYRMAAVGNEENEILFFGGSDNPYNYDGIGYNKIPAKPSNQIRSYDVKSQQWTLKDTDLPASMDHRGLLKTPQGMVVLGGMQAHQQVTDRVTIYKK